MSSAGRANEAGSVFRRVLATHFAVHGLCDAAVPQLELPAGVAPVRIELETSDPTDDVRVTFTDGRVAYVSAKRRAGVDTAWRETVEAWVAQVPTLTTNDLLVLAVEELAGRLRALPLALERLRADQVVDRTPEVEALAALTALIPTSDVDAILKHARIIEIPQATNGGHANSHLAALMRSIVDEGHAEASVAVLAEQLHNQSATALSSGVDNWIDALLGAGIAVRRDPSGPTGTRAAARAAALDAYRESLTSERGHVDLSLLAEDLPPLVIDNMMDGLRVKTGLGNTQSDPLLRVVRSWRRTLLIGQPGAGKSVAMRELAAHCVSHPHAPTPVLVHLGQVLRQSPEQVTLATLFEAAARAHVAEHHRPSLVNALRTEVGRGEAILLLDGLDECAARAPWMAEKVARIVSNLSERTGVVMATRANATTAAQRLNLPSVELLPPQDLDQTIDAVLDAAACIRAPHTTEGWLAPRQAWLTEARRDQPGLFTVPLLAILVTLICADTPEADLPKERALLLHRAVEQSVERWENQRTTDDRTWAAGLTTAMLLFGFTVLGRTLDGGATPTRAEAVDQLTAKLRDPRYWNLAPWPARELATDVLRFWDERVAVFVVDATDQLQSRSKVFSEIATAMWTREADDEELRAWVAEAVTYTGSQGALALAVGLGSRPTALLFEHARAGLTQATALIAELAISTGLTLSNDQTRECLTLLDNASRAAAETGSLPQRTPRDPSPLQTRLTLDTSRDPVWWPLACLMARLPAGTANRDYRRTLTAALNMDDEHRLILATLVDLTDAGETGEPLDADALANVQAVLDRPLPKQEDLIKTSRREITIPDTEPLTPGIDEVAAGAALHLASLPGHTARRLFDISLHVHGGGDVIRARLHRHQIDTRDWWKGEVKWERTLSGWIEAHKGLEPQLLADIKALSLTSSSPNRSDLWSYPDAAELAAAIGYKTVSVKDLSSAIRRDSPQLRRQWLTAMGQAYGVSISDASAQASHVLSYDSDQDDSDQTLIKEWTVLTQATKTKPVLFPDRNELDDASQEALLRCLYAHSDWLARTATHVLTNLTNPAWDPETLLSVELTERPRHRGTWIGLVAIATQDGKSPDRLARAAVSPLTDHRIAARIIAESGPSLDPGSTVSQLLARDPDYAVRIMPGDPEHPSQYWSCSMCRTVNPLELEECTACDSGFKPNRKP